MDKKVVQTARSYQHFAHDKNGGRFSILISEILNKKTKEK